MPLLWDYLLEPWRILSSFGAGTSTTLPPLSSGICSHELVDGQVLHICQVLGYSMPSFVFWASLLILGLFSVSSLALFFQCDGLANSLLRLTRELGQLTYADPQRLSRAELERLNAVMGKEAHVARAWRGFEETLLVSPQGDDVFTPQALDESFSQSRLLEENVQGAFFSSLPGILTGLGLLMTFVAILDGLSHVSVTATMDVKGIGGLINGLSGKFVSSVTAVTCAVLFVFVERVAYARPRAAYLQLLAKLNPRFRRKSTEYLLYQIQTQLAELAELGRSRKP